MLASNESQAACGQQANVCGNHALQLVLPALGFCRPQQLVPHSLSTIPLTWSRMIPCCGIPQLVLCVAASRAKPCRTKASQTRPLQDVLLASGLHFGAAASFDLNPKDCIIIPITRARTLLYLCH